jgi:hypothetical protein
MSSNTGPKLNPLFSNRMRDIQEGLLGTISAISEPLKQAQALVAELGDYVDFELAKAELALQTGKGDPQELETWIDTLQRTRAVFGEDAVTETSVNLRELYDTLNVHFEPRAA